MPIIKRLVKGEPLTAQEHDQNFSFIEQLFDGKVSNSDLQSVLQRLASVEEQLGNSTDIVAPTVIGSIPDRDLLQTTGSSGFDVSVYFYNGNGTLVYSLVNPPVGLTINSNTGIITEDKNSLPIFEENSPRIVVVRATNTAGYVDAAYSMIVRPFDADATILEWTVNEQQGGNFEVTYQVSQDTPVYILVSEAQEKPTDTQFEQGLDANGDAAAWYFEETLKVEGTSISEVVPSIEGNFYFHVKDKNSDSHKVSGPIFLDTKSPSITITSALYDEINELLTSTVEVSENNGNLYIGYWDKSNTPTLEQIKSGEGSTKHDIFTDPLSVNTYTLSVENGAEAGTLYRLYAYQEDNSGNTSVIVNTEDLFIPVLSSLKITKHDTKFVTGFSDTGSKTLTFTGIPNLSSNQKIVIFATMAADFGTTTNISSDLGNATKVLNARSNTSVVVFHANSTSSTVNVTFTHSNGRLRGYFAEIYIVENGEIVAIHKDSVQGGLIRHDIGGPANAGDEFLAMSYSVNTNQEFINGETTTIFNMENVGVGGNRKTGRALVPVDSLDYKLEAYPVRDGDSVSLQFRGI